MLNDMGIQTVIYMGDFDSQKGIKIAFTEALRLTIGAIRVNRITVQETLNLRRELADGEVWKTSNGNQI